MELSETFWVGFYSAVMACLLGLANVLYKSKCKNIKCCGCEIIRDVEVELKEDMTAHNRNSERSIDVD